MPPPAAAPAEPCAELAPADASPPSGLAVLVLVAGWAFGPPLRGAAAGCPADALAA